MFEAEDSFYFGLAPEGTRSLTAGWKSGFHRIAEGAAVPVFLGIIDYQNRRVGITGRLNLSGDISADMKFCADFYSGIEGRRPENASPVRLL